MSLEQAAERFRGKTVAIVGSAPSVLNNRRWFIDSHDVVVRVNNYRLGNAAGKRTDVHYSFYGRSIKKTAEQLRRDGVSLVMNKCPNSQPIQSDWHARHGKHNGIDFTYIYRLRAPFWFCDTYVPADESFIEKFRLLNEHVPTTGFAAILDVLACEPKSVYLTGFDFFRSKRHNVTERWHANNPDDPIGHRPEMEAAWLAANGSKYPLSFDPALRAILTEHRRGSTRRAAA